MIGRGDHDFANDMRAALEEQSPRGPWLLILFITVSFLGLIIWASQAELEEVTTGSGRVIPSRQIQVVQTLEGGLVRSIAVREGDLVEEGQALMQIDDTSFASKLGELRQRRWALMAEIARLEAEGSGRAEIAAPPEVTQNAPRALASEEAVFRSRQAKLKDDVSILEQQLVQKEKEYQEFKAKEDKLKASREPLAKELELTDRLFQRKIVPEVELLRLKRQMAEIDGELRIVEAALPRAEAAIQESRNRLKSANVSFQLQARERLAKVQPELAIADETIKAARDRVTRTALRAPVRGVINKLNVTTIGAVVQPGRDIIEIVPLDDTLLIEAQIRPQDVAFIRPDGKASVKLTAYDYLIYGALEGRIERISADTITDERGERFYRVIVRTDQTRLKTEKGDLPIIPGMVATVDIQTGEKTVLDYLLKPIRRGQKEALRER
ncbi:MAG: HlyD family type I secretion periplasmic adaptor subunit [Pseudomonadota bacterium]